MAYGAADSADAGYAKRIAYTIEGGKITSGESVSDPAGHAQACLLRFS